MKYYEDLKPWVGNIPFFFTKVHLTFKGKVDYPSHFMYFLKADTQWREAASVRHLRQAVHGIEQLVLPQDDSQQGELSKVYMLLN